MCLFKTDTTLDEHGFREIRYHMIAPKQKIFLVGLWFLIFGLFVWAIATHAYSRIIVHAVFLCLLPLEYFLIMRKNVKTGIARMKETGAEGYAYTTYFTENGLAIENHTTNASGILDYATLARLAETEHFYILTTKANQFSLINKVTIDEAGEKEAFLRHLREHCPRMKFRVL